MVVQRNNRRRPQKQAKGRESIRYQNIGLPLNKSVYTYIGKSSSLLTPGRTYTVIDTGKHWWNFFGYGVWFTSNEYPDTDDVDYGVFVNESYFKKNFARL